MPQSPNADLCGQPGSRRRFNTPALLLDLDAFEHNLAAMAALARRAGLGLRPHAKAHNQPGLAVCNAGLKAFATDSGKPKPMAGAPAGATYRFMGDEHGGIELPAGSADAPPLGAAVELLTSHCDPTVNLYDWLHCVRGDTLVEIWPVDARGR